jgi:Fibronectin type III domain
LLCQEGLRRDAYIASGTAECLLTIHFCSFNRHASNQHLDSHGFRLKNRIRWQAVLSLDEFDFLLLIFVTIHLNNFPKENYFKRQDNNPCRLWQVGITLALVASMSGTVKFCGLKKFVLRLFLCVACGMLVELPAVASSELTIEWNPSPDTNAVGYKVYYGTVSHNYTNVIVVGNTTNAVISGIIPGTTYYFAATTYIASGAESAYSAEISYTAPLENTLNSAIYSTSQFSFAVNGINGSEYVVEASTNLVNWVPLETNTIPFTFVDTNAPQFARRFYQALPQ